MIEKEYLKILFEKSKSVKQDTKDSRIWIARDLDEALAWLLLNVYYPSTIPQTGVEKHYFRGQSNSDWSIIPTIMHSGIDEELELLSSKLFEGIIESNLQEYWSWDYVFPLPEFNLNCGKSISRHYEMRNHLIDWTTSPKVAASFAENLSPKADSKYGAIYFLPFSIAQSLDLEIVFAPPFIRRIYLQRGVFIRAKSQQQLDLINKSAKKIIFLQKENLSPRDPLFSRIDMNTLMDEDKWFYHLNDFSRKAASDLRKGASNVNLNEKIISDLNMNFTLKYGYHSRFVELKKTPIQIFEKEYLIEIQNLINEHIREYDGKSYSYNKKMFEKLKADNPSFMKWLEDVKILNVP